MAYFGSEYIFHASSSMHDETGFPNNSPKNADKVIRRLWRKIYDNEDEIIITKTFETDDADILIIACGASARASREALNILRAEGIKVGLLQLNTIWPFADKKVKELSDRVKAIIVPEMNLGQIINEVKRVVGNKPTYGVNKVDSTIIEPHEIIDCIKEVLDNV
jgi:2-oxoglutarate ferredoxin oxidoreductase subunit alpha